jgi:hypothetical protein
MENYLRTHENRVRSLYNRDRAVFAEFLVADLLSGSSVRPDPGAPWDLEWPIDGRTVRVQVKCSGEYLPRFPDRPAKPSWNVKPPRAGWDAVARLPKDAGHHCDVFVLARHIGRDVEAGWSFTVLTPADVAGRASISAATLSKLSRQMVQPRALSAEVLAAVRQSD